MGGLPVLRYRAGGTERMDDPGSDAALLENTLRQFAWVNLFLTRIRYLLRNHVLGAMRERPDGPGRPYRVVDLGAGACETAAWLIRRAAREGLRVDVTACDHDPRVVAYARRRYGHVAGLRIVEADVVDWAFDPAPDFVFGNHILHHLDDAQCERLLARLSALEGAGIVLSDLRRSAVAYALYAVASLPLRRSFARTDGLLSIRRGFRVPELEALVRRSTTDPGAWRVYAFFPFRIVLVRMAR